MNSALPLTNLPFRDLPHQPNLFLSYVDRSSEVLRWYRHPPTLGALAAAAGEVQSGGWPRREMAVILESQNRTFGCSQPVFDRICELTDPDCVAVMTGQQAGLFTGPALTVYKALSAIRLSAELRRMGHKAVPVFWIASDDHDLAEITRLVIAGPGHETRTLDARKPLFGTTALPPRPVGPIVLPEAISGLVREYTSSFPGAWKQAVQTELEQACRPGTTVTEAFGRLLANLFGDHGLILFDPRVPAAKALAAPVIRRALDDAHLLRGQLVQRNRELQAQGFAPQVAVLPHSTMVFLEHEGERRLVTESGGKFALKDTDARFTRGELDALSRRFPERFSPNVLLRPLVQDHLFPTVAYVGGPAEVSYFAQTEPLYRHYGRPMPVVWPRASFTLLDRETCAMLGKRDLGWGDCFRGPHHMVRRILEADPPQFQVLLDGLRQLAAAGLDDLIPALEAEDPSLGGGARTIRSKLQHRIRSLHSKFIHSVWKQDTALREEVLRLESACRPNGNLQERELGFPILLAGFGPFLIETLLENLDPAAFEHRILCLQPDLPLEH